MIQLKPHPLLPDDARRPEILAARAEEHDTSDWRFRRAILQDLPERFAAKVADHYANLYEQEGRRIANLYMLDVKDDLSGYIFKLSADNDDLINTAKKATEHCLRLRHSTKSEKVALFAVVQFVTRHYKIKPPLLAKNKHGPVTDTLAVTVTDTVTGKIPPVTVNVSVTGVLNRLCNEHWWRRALRSLHIRNVEHHAIRSGYVHLKGDHYLSTEGFHRYMQQQRRNARILESMVAVNQQTGEEFPVAEAVEHSLANPAVRLAELKAHFRGFEDVAIEMGHITMFYTITCPSKMHAYHTRKGKSEGWESNPNPKYNKNTPKQAQAYLAKVWSRIRAKLKRDGIDIFGLRVTEAHQDGTPHWHIMVFMAPEHEEAITGIIRVYAFQEDGKEKGAAKHRLDIVRINPSDGSATGYILKYLSKGLTGEGMDTDLVGVDARKSSQRVRAWASIWGIRQFQFFGGPPVGIYRELRRLKAGDLQGLIEQIREAADDGKWADFLKLMGGPTLDRKDYPVTVARQWSDKPNRYQEPRGYQIIGLNYGKVVIPTRLHEWRIECRKKSTETRSSNPPYEASTDAQIIDPVYLNGGGLGGSTEMPSNPI